MGRCGQIGVRRAHPHRPTRARRRVRIPQLADQFGSVADLRPERECDAGNIVVHTNRTMKTIAVVGLLGILLVPALVMSATRVAIGTGPWSGVYFPVGEALAKVLNKHVPEIDAVPTPTVGSAHVLELVNSGEVSLAIVGLATAHFGVRGQREFARKYDNVGFVMAGMDAGQSLVTRAVSSIKTFADVKGSRLAANAPASKALLLAALKLYGIGEADVQVTLMSFAEQIAALREETIDAGFLAVIPRNIDVAGLASEYPVRILGRDSTKAKLFEAVPDWTPVAGKAGP